MILKRLIAQGFKSFADRTELDFDRGITGIVGPNGCGKSNVVDAIRWVLGEQSAKSLRGKQMLDVIFNGSGTRRSSGMAQVDLVFDNADGILPTDHTEVTVTRRLLRSGESEYLLNKQSCRLKDVRELFMDTGVGVDAYSVIEQGRVDALLQANPLERRMIFEEAAGISKFKARKKEAQRKLERVDQNLLRLQDIIDEIEKRLRSIKLAAGKARSYQQYSARLKELKSRFTLASYHELRQSQDALDAEATALSDQSTGIRTQLSDSEARGSAAQVRGNELERDISRTEAALSETQSNITGHEERIAAARHRAEEQSQALQRAEQRAASLAAHADTVRQQMALVEDRRAAAEAEQVALQAKVAELQQAERSQASEQTAGQQQLEDEKSGVIDLLRRTSALHNEIQNLSHEGRTLAGQRERLTARDAEIAAQLSELIAQQRQLAARRDEIAQLMAEQERTLAETKARSASVTQRRTQLTDRIAGAKEYRSGLLSRQKTLEELDRRREGLLAGAREVLARRDAQKNLASGQWPTASADESESPAQGSRLTAHGSSFDYVLGPVGELFEADVSHAALVEAVLGGLEQYLVVTARDALLADRETLAGIDGRVLAFCLDQIPAAISAPDLSGQPGYVACVLDWVRVPESCARLARHLLGQTFVVESLDDARRLAEMSPPGLRFVTLDGIVWEPDGRLALGSLSASTGLISRRSELRELHGQIEEQSTRIAELSAQLSDAETEIVHLDRVQQDLRTAVYEASTERLETDLLLKRVDQDVERLTREQPIIASEVETVARQMDEAASRETRSKSELVSLEASSVERQRRIEQMQADLAETAARLRTLGEQVTQARVATGEAAQRHSALREQVQSLSQSLAQAQTEQARAAGEQRDIAARIAEAHRTADETTAALATLREEQSRLTRAAADLRAQREQVLFEVQELAGQQRQLRAELEEVESQFHDRRAKLGEIRVRLEDLVSRTREELGVELAEQYAGYTPEQEQDWAAVEAEIADLRGKIERLGNVNIDAIAEQEELEKRDEFLTGQRDDLRESQRQLTALIEKLDADSQARFTETFEQIRSHFAELFRKLFGGGRAELTLQDAANVLECGIDITARPPGKEPRSIQMLSGGEKTMTAIALLLAVFRTRPSPFTLLDEVDAALDEANNERFNRVIREFLSHSQLIIITHSKRTMAVADVLYGITMQEAGVSKRVAVRLEDESAHEPETHAAVA